MIHPYALNVLAKIGIVNFFEQLFHKHQIDLVYFLSPYGWAVHFEKTNYITTVWDLCHRDHPEFPEVRAFRNLSYRENNYSAVLPSAVGILVDSETTKGHLRRRYGIDGCRIHVMPFQA